MAWPTPQFPPASGAFRSTHYDRVIPLWLALRERNAIVNNNATEWPIGQDPWFTLGQSGIIQTLSISGVNIRITDHGTDPDFNPDWIDEFGVKRWVSFAGTWHGVDITPAPSAYKVVIYPADSGSPSATQLCDASLGGVYDIEDNGDNWLEFFNDGTCCSTASRRATSPATSFRSSARAGARATASAGSIVSPGGPTTRRSSPAR
jgi:hypothetical protein